jgi:hypothetical protein
MGRPGVPGGGSRVPQIRLADSKVTFPLMSKVPWYLPVAWSLPDFDSKLNGPAKVTPVPDSVRETQADFTLLSPLRICDTVPVPPPVSVTTPIRPTAMAAKQHATTRLAPEAMLTNVTVTQSSSAPPVSEVPGQPPRGEVSVEACRSAEHRGGFTAHDQTAYDRFALMLGSEMDSDDLIQLLSEVIMGIEAGGSCLPDTPEVREHRTQLVKEVQAIRHQGLVPDVPHGFPKRRRCRYLAHKGHHVRNAVPRGPPFPALTAARTTEPSLRAK